jgi:1,4-alpha-glucan branching enzyme
VEQTVVSPSHHGGAGFDATQNDGLRDAIRSVIDQAAAGADAIVDMDQIGWHIATPNLHDGWRAVQCAENHDIVRKDRSSRIATLADGADRRSWFARSRARVATGLVATSMGIPHLFMGQEILEDKQWHDEPGSPYQIWWEGLKQDKVMIDFLRFTQELFGIRNQLPALRSTGFNDYHVHNDNRILAFHRWVEGEGKDVVVIVSLNESTFWNYELGYPAHGYWREVFNSDAYDNWINPNCAGNNGGIHVSGQPLHNLPTSAHIVIPANSIMIFAR